MAARNEYKAICKHNKEEYSKGLCQNINQIKNTKDWWAWVTLFKQEQKTNNCLINSALLAIHFSRHLNKSIPENIMLYAENLNESLFLDSDFDMQELEETLNSLKDCKAPGSDRLPIEIFKYGPLSLKKAMLDIFNKIFNDTSDYGDNVGVIIPLFKKGDLFLDRFLADNYQRYNSGEFY